MTGSSAHFETEINNYISPPPSAAGITISSGITAGNKYK
jgi:hypothetical protein